MRGLRQWCQVERALPEKTPAATPIEQFINVSEEFVKQTHKLIIDTPLYWLYLAHQGEEGVVKCRDDFTVAIFFFFWR